MKFRKILVGSALVLGVASATVPTYAKTIVVEVAPPALRVETVPPPRAGYYWAPGYWGYNHNKHVWVGGHWIRERKGYHWVPHRWEEHSGHWRLHDGYWEH